MFAKLNWLVVISIIFHSYICQCISITDSMFKTNNVIASLQHIPRNDNLQCVAKVLCHFISEHKAKSQFSNFMLPAVFKDMIYNFPDTSPNLLYSKAVLIGISDDGNQNQCYNEYPQCPGNKNDLLYYLNNHRGGLFKFFNGADTVRDEELHPMNPDNIDRTNFQDIINLLLVGFANEMKISESNPNEYNSKLRHHNMNVQLIRDKNIKNEDNENSFRKITKTNTRAGKIINRRGNNYDAIRNLWKSHTASEYNNKPLWGIQSTTPNPNIYVPNSNVNNYNTIRSVWKSHTASEYNNKPLWDNKLTTPNPNIYVTNSNGEIEYYINRLGQKIYGSLN